MRPPTPHDRSKIHDTWEDTLALMLYGVYVYQCSNSLGRASRILEPFVERSLESIRQWVQRLAPFCDELDVGGRLVTAAFWGEETSRTTRRRERPARSAHARTR